MTASTNNPLDPKLLRSAGVPLEDALWLTRVRSDRKTAALIKPGRGTQILNMVRAYLGVSVAIGCATLKGSNRQGQRTSV
ncbi:MAG: hypothetical protein KGZ70_12930 [Hydrogenophaga sp.]|nr:hypothetical protein [Hydrogenophaga sp.]